ncbi:MAG: cytochrome P460 family protein [Rhodospirillales bacterium]|nr:cytochrome P460 family protein [Rhodospirillales bacterium]
MYDCLVDEMIAAYDRAGLSTVAGFENWTNVANAPYQSATHGNRYVNNYVNRNGAYRYSEFEDAGLMPAGTVVAKDSFVVNGDGSVSVGPLFIMEKVGGGFNEASGNWRYTMVMPNGLIAGMTKGTGAANVQFCNECHEAVAEDQDYMFFLPEENRTKG